MAIEMKDMLILVGVGQIGMAIARRLAYGKKLIIGDKNLENAKAIPQIMNDAGFDAVFLEMDLSSRKSIQELIAEAQKYGEISMLVNAAGVTPTEELLNLEMLQPQKIKDTLHAYQIAKRCNEKRVMAESVKWGSVAPALIPFHPES